MARPKSLTRMATDALLKMREEIGQVLSERASALKKELQSLGQDYKEVARIAVYGKKSKLAGRKVAAKYRGPNGETWAGRGAAPRWLAAEMKAGKRLDSFLIEKNAAPRSVKKTIRGKK